MLLIVWFCPVESIESIKEVGHTSKFKFIVLIRSLLPQWNITIWFSYYLETGVPKSVVTLKQFLELAERVANLQQAYDIDSVGLMQHISGFKEKLSMSDPVALIQLSARLEQAERNLTNMTTLLTELANRIPGEFKPLESVEIPGMPNVPPPSPQKLFKPKPTEVNNKCSCKCKC